jgi:hypothetical protein
LDQQGVNKMRIKNSILALIFLFVFAYCDSPILPESPVEALLPVIEYFRADQAQISPGESSTLSWSTINAEQVLLFCWDNGQHNTPTVFVVGKTGTREVKPDNTTIYRLTAYNKAKDASEYLTVEVVSGQP